MENVWFFECGIRHSEINSRNKREALMKSRWITHRGKKIFIADYSEHGTNLDAIRDEVAAVIATISEEPCNSVLALTDTSYTYAVDVQSVDILLKNAFPKLNPYIKKRAIVGVSEHRKYLVPLFVTVTGAKPYHMFERMEQALDWLVSE
jgi:hypothetical protein